MNPQYVEYAGSVCNFVLIAYEDKVLSEDATTEVPELMVFPMLKKDGYFVGSDGVKFDTCLNIINRIIII